jgi:hypothetical protein
MGGGHHHRVRRQTGGSVDDLHRLLTVLPVGEPQPVDVLSKGKRVTRRVVPKESR